MELQRKHMRKLTPLRDSKTITDKLKETNIKQIQDERNETNKYVNWKISLYDFSDTSDLVSNFLFARKKEPSLFDANQQDFGSTKYVDEGSVFEFYQKYHKINDYLHKGRLSKLSPSFNFIKGVKDNNIVPNPVGVVKRKGRLASLELK